MKTNEIFLSVLFRQKYSMSRCKMRVLKPKQQEPLSRRRHPYMLPPPLPPTDTYPCNPTTAAAAAAVLSYEITSLNKKDDKLIFLIYIYICYYFLNPIWKRESEQDNILSRAELVAIHGEVFREDTMIEINHVITPINAPTIREIYQEYLLAHTSNERMKRVTRARTLSQQINLEFRALRMLMSNHHSDNSIPIDESIVMMSLQDL
ncbi:hypothetical protein AGLY_003267 [Aphis glycines]|uniref:Uncharacterized protein n=1 Tax=Aphis glycines TaxID=307491 RepID=A0A6G0U2E8_APHGL|nr:hypothetical protein AGLY_003267 [Aphis glycines]